MRRGRKPYHLRVTNVLKSGSLNLLEPSGPVQACNGVALPLCSDINTLRLWDKISPGNHSQNGTELHWADYVLRSYIKNYVNLFVFRISIFKKMSFRR